MDAEFQTPTMMKILLAQGDREGAEAILKNLHAATKKPLSNHTEDVLGVLEKWLNALRKGEENGLR